MRKIVIGLGLAAAAQLASAAPAIVGSWYASALTGYTGHAVVTFLEDGHYVLGEYDATSPANAGIEWGTYAWNASTGALTTTQIGDTNGDWGFSHPDGTLTFTVNGDTGSVIESADPASSVTAQRVGFAPGTILGTWYDADPSLVNAPSTITFLPNGTVIEIEGGVADADGQPGLGISTYSWNSSTGQVSFADAIVDTTKTPGALGWTVLYSNVVLYATLSGGQVYFAGEPGGGGVPYTAAVPETETWLLMAMGLTAVMLRRRGSTVA